VCGFGAAAGREVGQLGMLQNEMLTGRV
jgi:hypothetical protein